MRAHSVCAEGGTAAVLRTDEGDSLELHAWDTVKGSDFLADQDVVRTFVDTIPGLTPREREMILSENAAEVLRLRSRFAALFSA